MGRGRSSGIAVAVFVRECLTVPKWRNEWQNSTPGKSSCFIVVALILLRPEQPFNKQKRKPKGTTQADSGQTRKSKRLRRE